MAASQNMQLANLATVDQEHLQEMIQSSLGNPEVQGQMLEMVKEMGEKLNGKSLMDVFSNPDVSAEQVCNLLPQSLFDNIPEDSEKSGEDFKLEFQKSIGAFLDGMKDLQAQQVAGAGSGEPTPGIGRAQTMQPGEEIDTMEFKPKDMMDQLVQRFGNTHLSDDEKAQAVEQFSALMPRAVAIADAEEAKEHVDEYKKFADAFITCYRENGSAVDLMMANHNLMAHQIRLNVMTTEADKDLQDSMKLLMEGHVKLHAVLFNSNREFNSQIAKFTVGSEKADELMPAEVPSADDLQALFDEAVENIKEVIDKHAEAEEKAHEALAEDLD